MDSDTLNIALLSTEAISAAPERISIEEYVWNGRERNWRRSFGSGSGRDIFARPEFTAVNESSDTHVIVRAFYYIFESGIFLNQHNSYAVAASLRNGRQESCAAAIFPPLQVEKIIIKCLQGA
jgi:hypothetical protein